MLNIKVLGSGCPNCQRLEAETRAALDTAGITYDLTKVTDYAVIAAYGVMSTPALVINERGVFRLAPRRNAGHGRIHSIKDSCDF